MKSKRFTRLQRAMLNAQRQGEAHKQVREQAQSELFELLSPLVERVICSRLRSLGLARLARQNFDAVADAVISDVWMILFKKVYSFQYIDDESTIAWVAALAKFASRNRAWRYDRRQVPFNEIVQEDETNTGTFIEVIAAPGDFTTDVERRLIDDAILWNAISSALNQRERDAFLLRHLHGMSHKEITAYMGITLGYSRRLVSDAKRKLRVALSRFFADLHS